ncbi:MAG: hypothetical protein MUE34_16595 [Acidimicrobiales bacterium]|nr:hypothetical protein [Acidimicrobiales bacterium]
MFTVVAATFWHTRRESGFASPVQSMPAVSAMLPDTSSTKTMDVSFVTVPPPTDAVAVTGTSVFAGTVVPSGGPVMSTEIPVPSGNVPLVAEATAGTAAIRPNASSAPATFR